MARHENDKRYKKTQKHFKAGDDHDHILDEHDLFVGGIVFFPLKLILANQIL